MEPIEICDASGRVVGHFLLASDYQKLLCAAAEAACPYSEEELEQLRQQSGGRSLAEIWNSLGGT